MYKDHTTVYLEPASFAAFNQAGVYEHAVTFGDDDDDDDENGAVGDDSLNRPGETPQWLVLWLY